MTAIRPLVRVIAICLLLLFLFLLLFFLLFLLFPIRLAISLLLCRLLLLLLRLLHHSGGLRLLVLSIALLLLLLLLLHRRRHIRRSVVRARLCRQRPPLLALVILGGLLLAGGLCALCCQDLALQLPQPSLDLSPGVYADRGVRAVSKGIHTNGQRALGCQHAGDLALELGARLSDEGGMVDEAVLGCLVLGLECPEQGLLSSQDLHRGGGVLGQVGEAARVGDEAGAHHLPNQGRQVGRHRVHLVEQVGVEAVAVLSQRDDALGKALNVDEVDGGDVLAHRRLGCLHHLLGLGLIPDDLSQLWQLLLCQGGLVLDQQGDACILVVVVDDLDELGEVPAVPLPDPHHKGVDVLVQGVKQGNGLNDHVVNLVHVELDLGT
mmetsp:Transcript_12113/g.26039  ORF Transcript_12113/g.26039 Transcript_12113/m.26039 type:complete len:379 (-) Transcript_12113:661-1797(-)